MHRYPIATTIVSTSTFLIFLVGYTKFNNVNDYVVAGGVFLAVVFSIVSIIGFRSQGKEGRPITFIIKVLHNLNYVIIFLAMVLGLFFLILSTGLPPQD